MINFFNYRNRAERLKKVLKTFLANEPACREGLQNRMSSGHLVKIAPDCYRDGRTKNNN